MINEARIFVLNFGWVIVGIGRKEIDEYVLEKSASIRNWGTNKGIFQLTNGPLKETILDKSNSVLSINENQILFSFVVSEDNWEKELN